MENLFNSNASDSKMDSEENLFKSNATGSKSNANDLFKVPASVNAIQKKAEGMLERFNDGNVLACMSNIQDFKVFKKGQKQVITELVDNHIQQIREINNYSMQLLTNSIQNALVDEKTLTRENRTIKFAFAKQRLLQNVMLLTKDFLAFVKIRKEEIKNMDNDDFRTLVAEDLNYNVKKWFIDNKKLLDDFSAILVEYQPAGK